MAQDHGLCRKRKVKMEPAHGPPLQARVAAANGTVLQLANCWFYTRRSWRTWHEQGANKANERGQEHVKGSGDGMAKASRHTAR